MQCPPGEVMAATDRGPGPWELAHCLVVSCVYTEDSGPVLWAWLPSGALCTAWLSTPAQCVFLLPGLGPSLSVFLGSSPLAGGSALQGSGLKEDGGWAPGWRGDASSTCLVFLEGGQLQLTGAGGDVECIRVFKG